MMETLLHPRPITPTSNRRDLREVRQPTVMVEYPTARSGDSRVTCASVQKCSVSAGIPGTKLTRGGVMVILAVHQTPSLTQDKYEEVVRRLTGGKSRIESLDDLPFQGLLFHAAGQAKDGFCILDVFECEEAVTRFNAAIREIAQDVGIEEPPEFFSAHTYVTT
jgi:hypothetical protein